VFIADRDCGELEAVFETVTSATSSSAIFSGKLAKYLGVFSGRDDQSLMPMHIAFQLNRHVSRKLRVFIGWVIELMRLHGPLIAEPHGAVLKSP
jgi:hypothetical protein